MSNLDETLQSLEQLKNSIEQDSCISKDPFIKLEPTPEENAVPELKYTIPQATCYPVTAGINLDVEEDKFKASELDVPEGNFFDDMANKSVDEVRATLDDRMYAFPRTDILTDAGNLKIARAAVEDEFPKVESVNVEGAVVDGTTNNLIVRNDQIQIKAVEAPFVNSIAADGSQVSFIRRAVNKDYVAKRISQGYYPRPIKRFSGVDDIVYQEKPAAPKPRITMTLHYKMCSFSGDYGAGQTLKTFSLLPGEKTEISIRHFQRRESTRKDAQHVLDSFSQSSADDLQNIVEGENSYTHGSASTSTFGLSKERSGGVNASLNLGGVFSIGGNYKGGSTTTNNRSSTSSMEAQMRLLNKAVSTHVAKADSLRQIDINAETSSSSITEDEETIHRTIENYNKSRVLNFVFRQLLQEYISITSLVDVTFEYTNGYPESERKCSIDELENMLADILVNDTTVSEVVNEIYTYLCNIKNHLGTRESLIELSEETLTNCINAGVGEVDERYVKIKNNESVYDEKFPVKGIITSVTTRITRTGSLVCDALLGQGEALDCYNQKLQDAAAVNANLDNLELVQKITSIESIVDPDARAAAYKKIFGECCETAQTQVIS